MTVIRRLRADLAVGFGLLTRLPVGWLVPRNAPFRPDRASWCFPLVGALVQGVVSAVLIGAERAGLPPLLAAAWATGVLLLLTGALHEDGLADTADGIGGGRTLERRLEIMRDSRIGSYGALAIALALLVRAGAMESLSPRVVLLGLPCIGALSRANAVVLAGLVPPARRQGLGWSVGQDGAGRARIVAAVAALGMAACVLPVLKAAACIIGAIALLAGAFVSCRRLLGGQTGDTLGATVVITECCLLTLLAAGGS